MKLTYFYSSDVTRKPFSHNCNQGIQAVPTLLRQLEAEGYDVEFADTTALTEKERFESYARVALPAIYKRYEVRKVLGTNRRSACWFGAEVPALHVTGADSVGDTYPNRKGSRTATVHGFLTQLLAARTAKTNQDTRRVVICPLCMDPKSSPIVRSHLMPAALYSMTREIGKKNSRLVVLTGKTTTPTDKQIQNDLLCLACEDCLNRNGEKYSLSQVHDGKNFPLLNKLKIAMPLYSGLGVEKFSGDSVGVGTDKLAHFALGLFWKASVHAWRAHDGSTIHHSLGKYEEPVRRYLRGETGFPSELALIVTVCTDFYSQNNFYSPCEVTGSQIKSYGALTRGIHFRLFVGADLPEAIRNSCCISSAGRPIFTGDCTNISGHAFKFLHATSRPAKGMRTAP